MNLKTFAKCLALLGLFLLLRDPVGVTKSVLRHWESRHQGRLPAREPLRDAVAAPNSWRSVLELPMPACGGTIGSVAGSALGVSLDEKGYLLRWDVAGAAGPAEFTYDPKARELIPRNPLARRLLSVSGYCPRVK